MNSYISLAKQAVENYLKEGKIINPPLDLPKGMLTKKAGVFVSIYKRTQVSGIKYQDELRGCIGTFLPTTENVACEIIKNALLAATKDNRFLPIGKEELGSLSYSVDILSSLEPISDFKTLNPKKDGLMVRAKDGRCGLLLPDIAGAESPEQQFFIACQKGGINPQVDKVAIYRFRVERYKEKA